MSLFKHAMVSGINDALVDRGFLAWPDESVGFDVCSKLASDLSGPDMLPEGGLSNESAIMIGQQLKAASDTLIARGYGQSASSLLRTKQASAMDFTDRAAILAEACMSKAASDASLTDVGTNTAESAAHDDQHAALDLRNRAANKYLMGVGRTAFPSGGVVGQQMVYPGGPSRAGRNSLTALDKQANEDMAASDLADTMDGHGGHGGAGHMDPEALERAMMFLQALKQRGYHPGAEAQVAAGGLGESGTPGMEVMAHIIENVKTAGEADEIIAQILQHQGQAGELASPELVEAIQHLMAQEQGGHGAPEQAAPEQMPPEMMQAKGAGLRDFMKDVKGVLSNKPKDMARAARGSSFGGLREPSFSEGMNHPANDHPVGGAGKKGKSPFTEEYSNPANDHPEGRRLIAYKQGDPRGEIAREEYRRSGGKQVAERVGDLKIPAPPKTEADYLADETEARTRKTIPGVKYPSKYIPPRSKKASDLLEYLKAAADGSLTDVGPNTEESAAQHDQFAELDLKNRAANAYLHGVGNTSLPGGKQVFDISKVPGGEAVSNSVTEGTKSAEAAYVDSFRKIASEMGPHLPATMGRDEKVAHLQTMLGLPPNERVGYLKALRAG